MAHRPLDDVIRSGAVEQPGPVQSRERAQGVPRRVRADARKDVLLWPDQQQALNHLAWKLSRSKPVGVGERITANTLIRVAVDLLLAQADRVSGVSEAELRDSLAPPGS